MSNLTGDEGSFSSGNNGEEVEKHQERRQQQQQLQNNLHGSNSQQPLKKKRNLPGTPDPTAEVVALSPTTLMATNRFVCEICNKGFQRDQNLQLHRRGHNLPWKLKQRTSNEVKKRVYICPEPTCVHHNPARALGDLTGIKKHYSRKHGEKKWKCDKCSKKYAVQSDWKAHQKTCGTREYKCDCGTIFSRRDSFITHRAFCDALAEENNKVNQGLMNSSMGPNTEDQNSSLMSNTSMALSDQFNNYDPLNPLKMLPQELIPIPFKPMNMMGGMFSTSSGTLFGSSISSSSSSGLQLSSNNSSSFNFYQENNKNGSSQVSGLAQMSATALLQKAAQMGASSSSSNMINSPMMQKCFASAMAGPDHQVSGSRPTSYGPIQQHIAMNGEGLISTQHTEKTTHDEVIPTVFEAGNGITSSAMHAMSVYGGMLMDGDRQESEIVNNVELNNDGNGSAAIHRSLTNNSSLGANGSNCGSVMTLDLLGIGGSRSSPILHRQQIQQQSLEFDAMNKQGSVLQVMDASAVENTIWDV